MKTLKLCLSILILGLIIPTLGYGQCNWTLTTTDATCGLNNGSISITATGCKPINGFTVYPNGGLPYMTMQNPMTNLSAGTYIIYTNDVFGNLVYVGAGVINNVGEPIAITSIPGLMNVCNTDCNASLGISATSASTITGYAWSNGGTSSSITNLCPGSYSVTVTNADGCTQTASYNVGYLSYVNASISTTDNICPGTCTGTATANVSSNAAITNYSWSVPNANTPTISNLCDGNYSVTITNNMGCQTVQNFSITTNYALNTSWQKTTFNQAQKNDVIKRTLLDNQGNLYIMGEFEYESDLEGHHLSTNDQSQKTGIFVARYSSCGNLDWVSQLQNHSGNPYDLQAFDLDFDNNQSRIVVFGKWDNQSLGQEITWIDGLGNQNTVANTNTDEDVFATEFNTNTGACLLYTSPSPRDS